MTFVDEITPLVARGVGVASGIGLLVIGSRLSANKERFRRLRSMHGVDHDLRTVHCATRTALHGVRRLASAALSQLEA